MSAFTQKVLVARPPVWERCVTQFGTAQLVGRPVVFAWGRVIYNPTNAPISRPLARHEATHGERQCEAGDSDAAIMAWWERYLTDPQFRLDEEIIAHHAEHKAYLRRHGYRRRDLQMIASRLAGPLYGSLLTHDQAVQAVLTGERTP